MVFKYHNESYCSLKIRQFNTGGEFYSEISFFSAVSAS